MQNKSENPKSEDPSKRKEAGKIKIPEGLFFNILPLEKPVEPVAVDFVVREDATKHRFATGQLSESFRWKLKQATGCIPEFVYTDFYGDTDGFTLPVDFLSDRAVAKAWYTHKIVELLAPKTAYHRPDFLRDTQFWCHGEDDGNAIYDTFHKYTIRVQSDFITGKPELLISYDGCSYLLKNSLEALTEDGELDTRIITTVAFRKKIYRYDDLPGEALYSRDEVFPVMNRDLAAILKTDYPFTLIPQKYDLFYRRVEWFYARYCSGDSFTGIVPHKGQWKQVKAEFLGRLSVSDKKLVFGQAMTETDAYRGLSNWGPLLLPPGKHFAYFFIYFEHQEDAAHKLYNYLLKKEGFVRMSKFTHLTLNYEKYKNLVIKKGENPESKVGEYLQNTDFNPDVVYFAFYISPYSRFEADEQKKKLYYRIKELLLYRKISMQAVEGRKLAENFSNSIANIGIALIAKLGGVPWRLEGMEKSELVIGFGAYRNKGFNMGYTGSAICFSQDGVFREFDVFPAENTRSIAGSALKAFKQYRENYPEAKRMIIHFYKPMSRRELEPLEKMLREMRMDIPVVIAGISKTPSKCLLLFDHPEKNTMPADGTWAKTGKTSYLLNINLRKQETSKTSKQVMPLRIHFQCNREGYLEKESVVPELLEQIYAFSYLHWRSVRQSPLPVTVKYPALIASFMPWFDRNFLPPHGRTRPWFL